MRPSFASIAALKEEGAGKAGCALHPRSRVQLCIEDAHMSIQVQRWNSDFPTPVDYGLYVLTPAIGFACHRRQQNYYRRLDTNLEASAPHVFTIRARLALVFATCAPPHPTSRSCRSRSAPVVG